jgi:pimeloyl-ACP methyl ester carboxylesterase
LREALSLFGFLITGYKEFNFKTAPARAMNQSSDQFGNSNMALRSLRNWLVFAVSSVVLTGRALAAPSIKNVALVHGAFLDGSGWQPVYEILTKDGYHVSLVQEPLTSLEEDVAATRRVLDLEDGPTILVAHSYGGTVITEAGADPKVAALVFIAAHAPDVGETEAGNGRRFPNHSRPLVKTFDGFLFLDPKNFPQDFAADLPAAEADFMAHAQMPTAAKVFTTPVTNAAWKTKPSWYLVAKEDKVINPDLERMYAERARSHEVEAEGASHAVYISHAKEVAALIEDAAGKARVAGSH